MPLWTSSTCSDLSSENVMVPVIRSFLGGRAGSASEIDGLLKRVKITLRIQRMKRKKAQSPSIFKVLSMTIRRTLPRWSSRSSSLTFSSASALVKTRSFIRRRSHRCTHNFCSKNAVLKKSALIERDWLRYLNGCCKWSASWRNPIMCSVVRVHNRSNSSMDTNSYSNMQRMFSPLPPHKIPIL